jgi:hypothetical protein
MSPSLALVIFACDGVLVDSERLGWHRYCPCEVQLALLTASRVLA